MANLPALVVKPTAAPPWRLMFITPAMEAPVVLALSAQATAVDPCTSAPMATVPPLATHPRQTTDKLSCTQRITVFFTWFTPPIHVPTRHTRPANLFYDKILITQPLPDQLAG